MTRRDRLNRLRTWVRTWSLNPGHWPDKGLTPCDNHETYLVAQVGPGAQLIACYHCRAAPRTILRGHPAYKPHPHARG